MTTKLGIYNSLINKSYPKGTKVVLGEVVAVPNGPRIHEGSTGTIVGHVNGNVVINFTGVSEKVLLDPVKTLMGTL